MLASESELAWELASVSESVSESESESEYQARCHHLRHNSTELRRRGISLSVLLFVSSFIIYHLSLITYHLSLIIYHFLLVLDIDALGTRFFYAPALQVKPFTI